MHRLLVLVALAAAASLPVSCASGPPASSAPEGEAARSSPSDRPAPSTSSPEATTVDPATVEANELGDVPVLMYHRIARDPEGVYERSPQGFRAELERLAREDYVPVTAGAYVSGEMDVPAGKHPVVLTFDDSTSDQLALDPAGRPDPGTAVGILLDVAAEHPGFRPAATFFVNRRPFSTGGARALTWLHENGFGIGNHTYTHENLAALSPAGVRRQVARLHRMVTSARPGARVTTMALPLGVSPDNAHLAARGSWHGVTYDYRGVFLVGAGPAPSPHADSFDRLGIPRIRSQSRRGPDARYCSTRWLDYLEKHPRERYTSDGDPTRVSFPRGLAREPAADLGGAANPY